MSNLTPEQRSTNFETYQHIDNVIKLLIKMQIEISKRILTHDRSKLANPEVSTFTEFTPKLKNSTYGSDEYKSFLAEMKPALDHHYAHNRHHPEYFKECEKDEGAIAQCANLIGFLESRTDIKAPDDEYGYGHSVDVIRKCKDELESDINGMNIIDVLEMIVDWKAASLRHADGDINRSIEINTDRFKMSPQLVNILKNSVALVVEPFPELKTQKDI